MKPLLERMKAIDWIDMDGYTIKFSEYSSGFVAYAVDEHDNTIIESSSQATVEAARDELIDLMGTIEESEGNDENIIV